MALEIFLQRYNVSNVEYTAKLDVDPDETIDITYNIADVNNISARNSSYSKTITLPDTGNNREIFSYIYDLNFEVQSLEGIGSNYYFNPNKKTKCTLIVDDVIIFKGYLQLTKVNYHSITKTITYDVTVYDNTQNLYTLIADKKLTDIDFSNLNHIYNQTNIYNSWYSSTGPYYPFIDWGKNWVWDDINGTQPNRFIKSSDFKPALPAKDIFDRIIYGVSCSYTSTFLNSTRFKNLIVPLGSKIHNYATFSSDKVFKVSCDNNPRYALMPNNGVIGLNHQRFYSLGPNVNGTGWWQDGTNTGSPISIGTPATYKGGVATGQMRGAKIILNDESTAIQADNYDSNNMFDNSYSVYEFVNNVSEVYNQRFTFNFEAWTKWNFRAEENRDASGRPVSTTPNCIQVTFYRQFNPSTGVTSSEWVNGLGIRIPPHQDTNDFMIYDDGTTNYGDDNVEVFNFKPHSNYYYFPWGLWNSTYIKAKCTSDWLDNRYDVNNRYRPLYPGEKVRVVVRWYNSVSYWAGLPYLGVTGPYGNPFNNNCAGYNTFEILGGLAYTGDFAGDSNDFGQSSHFYYKPNTCFYNEVDNDCIPGGIVRINNNLPANITQADFIASIIKMFNLYIQPDPNFEGNLLIEPRDDYYNNGELKDWTNKLENAEDLQIQILAETQNKVTVFKYKEDSDYYNTYYQNYFNSETFGQYTYDITGNEYLKGKKEVGVIFSNSPMVKMEPLQNDASFNFIYPRITNDLTTNNIDNQNISPNIRIMQRYQNGLYPLTKGNILVWDNVNRNFNYYNGYPYAGHLDNPYNPTFDLCFGQPRMMLHQYKAVYNNLVNTYWKNMLDEVSSVNSRIVTAKFYLTPVDIHNFKFSDIIYLAVSGDYIGGGGQYYRVNKISGYNPNNPTSLCEVELIKADKVTPKVISSLGGNYAAQSLMGISSAFIGVTASDETSAPWSVSAMIAPSYVSNQNVSNYFSSNDSNTINKSSVTLGANNFTNGQAIINGGGVKILSSGDNIFVNGDDTTINGGTNQVFVVGSGITIEPLVNNVFVVGDDLTINNSDTVVFGKPIRQFSNRICAGIDEVLGEFSDGNIINRVSAGRDKILGYGSYTAINRITAGRDNVL